MLEDVADEISKNVLPTLTNAAQAGVDATPVYQEGTEAPAAALTEGVTPAAAAPVPTTDAQYQAAWAGMAPEQIAASINQVPGAAGNMPAVSEEYRLAWLAEQSGAYMGPGKDPLADVWGADPEPAATTDTPSTEPGYTDSWNTVENAGPGSGATAGGGVGDATGEGATGGVGGGPGAGNGGAGTAGNAGADGDGGPGGVGAW